MDTILLIGLQEKPEVARQIKRVDRQSALHHCHKIEEAKAILAQPGISFFVLNADQDYQECLAFFCWLMDHGRTRGVLVGDAFDKRLAIDSLNSGLFMNALLLPATDDQWIETIRRFREINSYNY